MKVSFVIGCLFRFASVFGFGGAGGGGAGDVGGGFAVGAVGDVCGLRAG